MNRIGKIAFDFTMQNEAFARALYARWDPFFALNFERIADELLARHDTADNIEIETMTLDLGTIPEHDFDNIFPSRVREKLEEYLVRYLQDAQPQFSIRKTAQQIYLFDLLSHFLLHGTLSWNTPAEYKNIPHLFSAVLQKESLRLKQFLLTHGHYTSLQERLVYQLNDPELEKGVQLLEPAHAGFICAYVRLLHIRYKEIEQPEVQETAYRHTVWLVVYAYLLNKRSSYFNKKSFLMQTLLQLATTQNLSYEHLLEIITRELETFVSPWVVPADLFKILSELRKELSGKQLNRSAFSAAKFYRTIAGLLQKELRKGVNEKTRESLMAILSRLDSCRAFLKQLSENEIIALVPVIVPNDSDFVIETARALDTFIMKNETPETNGEEPLSLFHSSFPVPHFQNVQGKSGGEFRLLKWQLIFPLLLENKGSALNRKYFVESLFRQVAAHYNLTFIELLSYICQNPACLDLFGEPLKTTLQTLYSTEREKQKQKKEKEKNERRSIETEKIVSLLKAQQPVRTIQHYTGQETDDPEILPSSHPQFFPQLIRRLFPKEATFIITYAQSLDTLHDRGALEGKAGGEFRDLKWEFILTTLSQVADKAFNRRYFVEQTLQQIAAHYNLTYFDLLRYFQVETVSSQLPFQLQTILNELFRKEKEHCIRIAMKNAGSATGFKLLEIFAPGEQTFIRAYLNSLDRYGEQKIIQKNSSGNFREITWKFVLEVLLELPNIRFNRKQFISLSLRKIAAHYNLSFKEILTFFISSGYSPGNTELSNIINLIKEIYSTESGAEPSTHTPRFLTEKDNTLSQTHKKTTMEQHETEPYSDPNERKEALSNADIQFISNAGITLLSPYLPRLFAMLGLTDKEHFYDRESRLSAMFLIQYAAFNRTDFPEHEMTLNKLLTGFETGTPIPKSVALKPEEKEMVENMLKGALQNWPKLKNTSVAAFQEAFLHREGKLEEKEDFYLLTVEEKAYDLLLDSIPWNFRTVKYPWMNKMIQVKWR